MTSEILAQIESIELQLAILKARVKAATPPSPPKTFADLYGIASGTPDVSDQEIKAAEYTLDHVEAQLAEPDG